HTRRDVRSRHLSLQTLTSPGHEPIYKFSVIARSQRVRAKRRPMTGSAVKQSGSCRTLDCFALFATTETHTSGTATSIEALATNAAGGADCGQPKINFAGLSATGCRQRILKEWNVSQSARRSTS